MGVFNNLFFVFEIDAPQRRAVSPTWERNIICTRTAEGRSRAQKRGQHILAIPRN
jgi:hypothetical protein